MKKRILYNILNEWRDEDEDDIPIDLDNMKFEPDSSNIDNEPDLDDDEFAISTTNEKNYISSPLDLKKFYFLDDIIKETSNIMPHLFTYDDTYLDSTNDDTYFEIQLDSTNDDAKEYLINKFKDICIHEKYYNELPFTESERVLRYNLNFYDNFKEYTNNKECVFVTTNYNNSENDSHEKDCYFIKFYFIDSDSSLYCIQINIDVDECRIGVYYYIVCSGPEANNDFSLISSWKRENTILLIPYENWKHMKEVVKDFKGYCKIKGYHIR